MKNILQNKLLQSKDFFFRLQNRIPLLRSQFIRNWFSLSFSDIIGQIISFFAMFRVARHLAPEQYGVYSLILSTASLFGMIAIFGLSQVVITEVAKNNENSSSIAKNVLKIRFITIPLALFFLIIYYLFIKHEGGIFVIVITSILIIVSNLSDIVETLAFGRQKMKYTAILNLANSLLWVACLYIIPINLLTVDVVISLYVSLQALWLIAYFIIEKRNHFFQQPRGASEIHQGFLVRMALPYYWMNLIGTAMVQMPVLLLGNFAGAFQVGLYNAGYRLVMPLTLLLNGLSTVLFPKLVEVRQVSNINFVMLVYQTISWIVYIGVLLSLLITAFSREIILFTVGPDYLPAISSFSNQVWYLFLYSIYIIIGITLSSMEKQRILAVLSTINIVISFCFIYFGSQQGASTLSLFILISYLINLPYHFLVMQHELKIRMKTSHLIRESTMLIYGVLLSRLIIGTDNIWLRILIPFAFVITTMWFYINDFAIIRNSLFSKNPELV